MTDVDDIDKCALLPQELTQSDIDNFIDLGYCVLKGAFPKSIASQCVDLMWSKAKEYGVCKENSSTWPIKLPLTESYGKEHGQPWASVFTPKLMNSLDFICGQDNTTDFACGWWMITFPQASDSPDSDWKPCGSWHIDGQNYTHFPYSKELALTPIMYFSDVNRNWGGTAVAEGSHHSAARILRERGLKGCESGYMSKQILENENEFTICELTGEAGDIILMHPLLLHARSSNLGPVNAAAVRFMCHPGVRLVKEMDFSKPNPDEYTVLEASIICGACGCTSAEWCLYKQQKQIPIDQRSVYLESLIQRIDQCILDLSVVTPDRVQVFLDNQRQKRKRDDEEAVEEKNEEGDDILALMGFSSFS